MHYNSIKSYSRYKCNWSRDEVKAELCQAIIVQILLIFMLTLAMHKYSQNCNMNNG